MYISELLNQLDFGNQVAEFDGQFDRHFIFTDAFRALVEGRADIVAGDKGTGKTTIYRYLKSQYTHLPQLKNVEVISGFNPSGSPVFSRLTQMEQLTEGQYLHIWKMYVLSLVGNWLLQLCEGSYGKQTEKLNALLRRLEIRSEDDKAESIFTRLMSLKSLIPAARSLGVELGVDHIGNPTVTPKIEWQKPERGFAHAALNAFAQIGAETTEPPQQSPSEPPPFTNDDALRLLDRALAENDITVWVLLDRLDEAFVGYPQFEVPILRALLRAYLDLLAFDRIGIKLFVRKDLFRKVVRDGFVNLTHVNARKVEIIWEEEDLMSLICSRVKASEDFIKASGIPAEHDRRMFDRVFPPRMEGIGRNPATWDWVLAQIKDGNGVIAPRNLVELAILAKQEQSRREQRRPRYYSADQCVIEADALVGALSRLSVNRVQDTLLAEVSREVAALVTAFKDSKRAHDDDSIAKLFGVSQAQAHEFAETLMEIGLLEDAGRKYKVAPLYRDGLSAHRGRL